MSRTITLAVDVDADPTRVFEILSTTEGQRGVLDRGLRRVRTTAPGSGSPQAPVDLLVDVTTEPGKLVRMQVTSGFPFWEGSTWEWELGPATRAESGHRASCSVTTGSPTATPRPTSATPPRPGPMVLDRLARYVDTGHPAAVLPGPRVTSCVADDQE